MKLDGSIAAVVTGGASGLGEGTARAIAATGAKVALFDFHRAAEIIALGAEAAEKALPAIEEAVETLTEQ